MFVGQMNKALSPSEVVGYRPQSIAKRSKAVFNPPRKSAWTAIAIECSAAGIETAEAINTNDRIKNFMAKLCRLKQKAEPCGTEAGTVVLIVAFVNMAG
jgi:hypothetical protein